MMRFIAADVTLTNRSALQGNTDAQTMTIAIAGTTLEALAWEIMASNENKISDGWRGGAWLPFETHSLPALARCYRRSFAFYVHSSHSLHSSFIIHPSSFTQCCQPACPRFLSELAES